MSGSLLLAGGRVIDPSSGLNEVRDVLVRDGRIEAVEQGLAGPEGIPRVEARGLVVAPGLIDVHVHLREPGAEHKETIRTGAQSAAAGGFTTIWAMPNTDPPLDDPAAVGFVREEARRWARKGEGGARVSPVAAASLGLAGEQMTEIGGLVEAGAVAVTDDGHPIHDPALMRRLLEYTQSFGIPVLQHAEDMALSAGGVMNEGAVATALGLRGIPNASEATIVARDIYLAELTGGHVHVQHVSTREAVELIRAARERGVRVSGEASPHHMALTEEAVRGYRTEAKMNPPLRSAADRLAVRQGLIDGVLECVATDHAPHHYEEKEREFDDAPFGIVGLETALAVCIGELVKPGDLPLFDLVERMSTAPARLMGIEGGTLRPGSRADIVLFDPEEEWTVDPASFRSKSRNTPFIGWEVTGRVKRTIVGGETRYHD
ncbi:dihydroorotase [Candidatus Palauibacter polyketidifaciens]|uniref:dihydroorotase n=1 Tax=Candidatus Palauibacter polyketidifaciens TaxID=3056740 RepID=UPI0023A6744E|nr:dihydroorotase [Candidatus Palauibacter polyketidifaciens]MDE2719096.1 dihydroorotase [Candidatus Palauibacter polyketidifaciens]